jgi:hypothetical protein
VKKYGLPKEIAECYKESLDFFSIIKTVRDDINHHSIDANIVFCLEDGFALQVSDYSIDPIAKNFHIWPPEKIKENGLVSILALYSYVTRRILEQMNGFSSILRTTIVKDAMINPDFKVFLRGPYVNHLNQLNRYLEQQWIKPVMKTE